MKVGGFARSEVQIIPVVRHATTAISDAAELRIVIQTEATNRVVESSDSVYVRVNGEAVRWNTNVDVDFETDTALRPP